MWLNRVWGGALGGWAGEFYGWGSMTPQRSWQTEVRLGESTRLEEWLQRCFPLLVQGEGLQDKCHKHSRKLWTASKTVEIVVVLCVKNSNTANELILTFDFSYVDPFHSKFSWFFKLFHLFLFLLHWNIADLGVHCNRTFLVVFTSLIFWCERKVKTFYEELFRMLNRIRYFSCGERILPFLLWYNLLFLLMSL